MTGLSIENEFQKFRIKLIAICLKISLRHRYVFPIYVLVSFTTYFFLCLINWLFKGYLVYLHVVGLTFCTFYVETV